MSRQRWPRWQDIRRNAVLAAERTHARLGTDQSKRIDVFKIIETERLWLMFQPLDRLYGAYMPIDTAPGILLQARHPLPLQRFTAAHEYGHHVLGHGSHFDVADTIEPHVNPQSPEEVAAQAFAAAFLMPPQLVNTVFRRRGLPPRLTSPQPADIYEVALDLGVSYSAAVTQLAALQKLDSGAAAGLHTVEPKAVKELLGRGVRPEDPWADVWLLDEQYAGTPVYARVNDEVRITLPETPSTGYIWTFDSSGIADLRPRVGAGNAPSESHLALIAERFDAPVEQGLETRLGSAGSRLFGFRILQPGSFTLRLIKRRPWRHDAVASVLEFPFECEPKQASDGKPGLSERQKSLVALAA